MDVSSSMDVMAALRSGHLAGVGLAELALNTTDLETGWQQLLPAGLFSAVDGRPFDVPGGQWFIDGGIAEKLIIQAKSAANELVIDYEHQTILAESNGQPAPAAGWFSDVQWRAGSGLWIRPKWTPRALEFIRQGEYRYLSAVFPYSKATGAPTQLHSAALVNRPGLDGLKALQALKANASAACETLASSGSAVLYAGTTTLTADEAAVADRHHLSQVMYLAKRETYCRQRGSSWAQLSQLTALERDITRNTGQPEDLFLSSKVTLLAEDVVSKV